MNKTNVDYTLKHVSEAGASFFNVKSDTHPAKKTIQQRALS